MTASLVPPPSRKPVNELTPYKYIVQNRWRAVCAVMSIGIIVGAIAILGLKSSTNSLRSRPSSPEASEVNVVGDGQITWTTTTSGVQLQWKDTSSFTWMITCTSSDGAGSDECGGGPQVVEGNKALVDRLTRDVSYSFAVTSDSGFGRVIYRTPPVKFAAVSDPTMNAVSTNKLPPLITTTTARMTIMPTVTTTSAPSATTVEPSPCGNGIVEVNEECDDGNTVGGDGCSASCQAERTDVLNDPPATTTHHPGVCGDGIVRGGEECDDGNVVSGDGCSRMCLVERKKRTCGSFLKWLLGRC